MPETMDWPLGEALAGVTRACQHLREGRLVVLPTESVYIVVAGALAPGAVTALDQAIGKEAPLTLLLGQAVEVFDWLPYFRGVGVRLAQRFWPGPLTLVSGTGAGQGLLTRLPEVIRKRMAPIDQLSVRLPDHAAARKTAMHLGMPLLAATTPWISSDQVAESLGNKVALIIHNGRSSFAQADSAVQVHGRAWRLLREGAILAADIEEAARCRIMFVCTGNTCRSPLAAGLCGKLLADKLGCAPEDLRKHGVCVQSAGLAAMMGAEATPEAIAVAREFGADLTAHRSQPLTIEMVLQANRLFTMTASHLRMLHGVRGVTPRLLAFDGEDVADPIGGSSEIYRECAGRIKSCLEQLLPELLEC